MKWTKKRVEVLLLVVVVLIVIIPPLYARTKSYPLAIVSGNSMYPTLQNGDLVFYKATNTANIHNGTIIVFVQGDTSEPLLDGLIRPVLIHRIVSEEIQSDGTVLYQTKGDNNQANDPFLTKPDQVLGVATLTVPKVGLAVLFLQSPQGLIATIGIISLAYLSMTDMKRREEKKKEKLLGALAKKVLNGDLSSNQFEKLELAAKYSGNIEALGLKDANVFDFVDWLNNGGLDENWKMKPVICAKCSNIAIGFEGEKNNSLAICPHCHYVQTRNASMVLTEKRFNQLLLESIDEALSVLGAASKEALYTDLEREFTIKKKEIPQRLDDFSFALKGIFGKGSESLNLLLVGTFAKKLPHAYQVDTKNVTLQEYVKQAQNFTKNLEKEKTRKTLKEQLQLKNSEDAGNTNGDLTENETDEVSLLSSNEVLSS